MADVVPSNRLVFLATLAFLIALPGLGLGSPRHKQCIDDRWRFTLKNPDTDAFTDLRYDDSHWREVQLPHDYVVETGFDQHGDGSHGFRPKPLGWYRKMIVPPSNPGGRYWLEFDGIFRDSTVWVNGHKLGGHQSGYTSFYFDATQYLKPNTPNVIAVKVDPSHNEGWWYEGGGIYRHVWLTTVAPVHVAHWGTFVSTPAIANDKASIHAEISVFNESATPQKVIVDSIVMNGRSIVGKVTSTIDLGTGANSVHHDLVVKRPQLWSLENPHRYILVTEIKQGSKELDRYETPFGIRTIRFDPDKGFFLNDKSVKLNGTANHQDFGGVGNAVTDNLERLRIQKLKAMGSNAFRCSHNPPNAELLDACDELGMLVIDENRHPGDTFEGKTSANTPFEDMSEVDAMVLRDRNHPSIIAWSLCNEEWSLQTTAAGVKILTAVNDRVKALDPTRLTAIAFGGGAQNGNSPNLRDVADITGANYGFESYDGFHKRFPSKILAATEFSAIPNTRGIYVEDPLHGYQTSLPEVITGNDLSWMKRQDVSWEAVAARSFVAGGFVWTGFDYRGEPTPYKWPYEWPDVISSYGQMDLCGFPKDAYYYFQSAWGPETRPIVHVFPHWNWPGDEGKSKKVCVYTNAEEVELFLNGKSVGERKKVQKNVHVEWLIPYHPGVLVARGYRNGRPFGMDQVQTTDNAEQISAWLDNQPASADLEQLVCVDVALKDARGRSVPTACNKLTFEVSGSATIVGAGSGDNSCHEPESTASLTAQAFSYPAFNGYAMVALRPTGQSGIVTLRISGVGLKDAVLTFDLGRK